MLTRIFRRALPLAFALSLSSSALAFAEPVAEAPAQDTLAAAPVADTLVVSADQNHWTAHGFNITAPSTMWPMLELLHTYHFDWELYSAQSRPTPIVWAPLPSGVYGQYVPSQNIVKLSWLLQNEDTDLATSFLAHELTHLTDDLNGKLGSMTGDACYAAETRAFVNEANFWEMLNGPQGKANPDGLETEENAKMFAFVGNAGFADLVLRTTQSYIRQCGS